MRQGKVPDGESRVQPQAPSRREWTIAVLVALIAIALTLVPYALGYALARPGLVYTGTLMNPEDSQSYFAKMLQGYDGQWLYTIPYTTEEHAPAFVGGFYLFLGHLARGLGLTLETTWHVARVFSELVLFVVAFGFIADFVHEPRARWTAYVLSIFGSGLGWLLFLLNQPYWLDAFPVDFKMPEAHLFFSALTYPHVAIGTVLILASLSSIRRIVERGAGIGTALAGGLANLAIGIVYPFLIYLIAAVAGLYLVYSTWQNKHLMWRQALWIGLGFLIAAPLFALYALTLMTNPVFRSWDSQSVTLSPPLPHYLVAYGIMLLLASLLLFRDGRRRYALLWAWVAAAAILVYVPINPQRRFVEGVQVPLAILAAEGLYQVALPWVQKTKLFQWLAARPHYSVAGLTQLLSILFLFTMSLSNLYILASLSVTMSIQQPYPLFRSSGEIDGVNWLRASSTASAVVLGDEETGNYVAAHAGNRVVIGHWSETVDWEERSADVKRFFQNGTDDAWRATLLVQRRVQYVFWGPQERKLGKFDPSHCPLLEPAFTTADIAIYRVRP